MGLFSLLRSPAGSAFLRKKVEKQGTSPTSLGTGREPAPSATPRKTRTALIISICILIAGASTYAVDRVGQELEREEFAPPLGEKNPKPSESPEMLLPPRQVSLIKLKARKENNGDTQGLMHGRMDPGTLAPDFSWVDTQDGHLVSLTDFRGKKPVVLIFGSFSCTLFCADAERLERLYQDYKGSAMFLFIHIRDAQHPVPALALVFGNLLPIFVNRGERTRRAIGYLDLNFPCLIDTPDDEVEFLYDAYPRRLMIVDDKGKIALDAGKGLNPDAWNLETVEGWLKRNAN
jgi:peroxiredoxin